MLGLLAKYGVPCRVNLLEGIDYTFNINLEGRYYIAISTPTADDEVINGMAFETNYKLEKDGMKMSNDTPNISKSVDGSQSNPTIDPTYTEAALYAVFLSTSGAANRNSPTPKAIIKMTVLGILESLHTEPKETMHYYELGKQSMGVRRPLFSYVVDSLHLLSEEALRHLKGLALFGKRELEYEDEMEQVTIEAVLGYAVAKIDSVLPEDMPDTDRSEVAKILDRSLAGIDGVVVYDSDSVSKSCTVLYKGLQLGVVGERAANGMVHVQLGEDDERTDTIEAAVALLKEKIKGVESPTPPSDFSSLEERLVMAFYAVDGVEVKEDDVSKTSCLVTYNGNLLATVAHYDGNQATMKMPGETISIRTPLSEIIDNLKDAVRL